MIATNLLAWSIQVAALVAGASLLPSLFRLDVPGVRYAYWRMVSLLCLALPWIQPYRETKLLSASTTSAVTTTASSASAGVAQTVSSWNWEQFLIVVLVVGIAVRLAWLATGLMRLRRLRDRATRGPIAHTENELQASLKIDCQIRYARDIDQPLTFGVRRPIVILPEKLRGQATEIQQAVLGHELFHVKRSDWAWLIIEELAVCVFWFHPASWWLASQIQRAREEVVDELTILLIGRRKTYVEALLAFSDATSIVPTAAFARRRHLFRRIALVSKETAMSSRRIVATCAAMALLLGAGSWYAVSAFPLQTAAQSRANNQLNPGPLELKAHQVTPENPIPRRLHFEPPVFPDAGTPLRGSVGVNVTLDDVGRVAEARLVEFTLTGPDFNMGMSGITGGGWDGIITRGRAGTARALINSSNINEQITGVFDAAVASVRQWRYDPPAEAPLTFAVKVPVKIGPEVMEFKPAPGNAAPRDNVRRDDALRVGGNIKAPKKIKDVRPIYPPIAREAGVAGVVILEVRIGADGFIEDGRVIKSIPLLDEAALDAVKQWQFEPTLMNGQPIPVIMTVTINFYQ